MDTEDAGYSEPPASPDHTKFLLGVEPAVWAYICVLFVLLGLILFAIICAKCLTREHVTIAGKHGPEREI